MSRRRHFNPLVSGIIGHWVYKAHWVRQENIAFYKSSRIRRHYLFSSSCSLDPVLDCKDETWILDLPRILGWKTPFQTLYNSSRLMYSYTVKVGRIPIQLFIQKNWKENWISKYLLHCWLIYLLAVENWINWVNL